MANEKNLKPIRTAKEAREKGRKGGIASGKARREKRTIQNITSAILEKGVKDITQFKEIASIMGVSDDTSVKELYVMVCLLNGIREGNLAELERLTKILGEESQTNNEGVLGDILEAVRGVGK